MSSFLRRLLSFEIRIRRRWRANEGVYAIVGGSSKYQIDDIGLGGLSFHYTDIGSPPKKGAYGLSIHLAKPPITVKLKGRTVSDEEIGELVFLNRKIKRRSVRFEPLNREQKRALRALIKSNIQNWHY